MEACFDALVSGVCSTPPTLHLDLLKRLTDYYGSLWRYDFELDEKGSLPPELKRGVLSQDGVYNLLDEIKSIFGV